MQTLLMLGQTIPEGWRVSASVSNEAFSIALHVVNEQQELKDKMAEITLTAEDVASLPDLADNARFLIPFNTGEHHFEELVNVQKAAFLRGVSHDDIFKELTSLAMVHLFVPFSADFTSFEDASLGFIVPSRDTLICDVPVTELRRFHYRDVWHYPNLVGPLTVRSDQITEYTVSSIFRGTTASKLTTMSARATQGTLSEKEFTMTGAYELLLDTTGVPDGSDITLFVNSRFGTPEVQTASTLTVRVENP